MSTTIPTNANLCNTNTVTFCAQASDPCSLIGPEWVLASSTTSSRCPSGEGERTCSRSTYQGNPQDCCVNNYEGANPPNNNLCFSDPTNDTMTCDPNFRSITGSGCEGLFLQTCVNGLTTDQEFQAAWSGPYCSTIINQHVQSGTPMDIQWAQQSMQAVFNQYYGPQTSCQVNTNTSSTNTFQETLYELCSSNPEACAPALSTLCAPCSLEAAQNNINVAQLCGCYLQASAYLDYTSSFDIPFQCSPICARSTSIQPPSAPLGVGPCTESICIIDNTTFSFINSSAQGISFGQICGGCSNTPGSSCQCVISGVDLNVAQSEVGNINLSQNCGGSLNCTVPNPNNPTGPAISVPCTGQTPTPSSNPFAGFSSETLLTWGLIGLVVLIIIVIIIIVVVKSRSRG